MMTAAAAVACVLHSDQAELVCFQSLFFLTSR